MPRVWIRVGRRTLRNGKRDMLEVGVPKVPLPLEGGDVGVPSGFFPIRISEMRESNRFWIELRAG